MMYDGKWKGWGYTYIFHHTFSIFSVSTLFSDLYPDNTNVIHLF